MEQQESVSLLVTHHQLDYLETLKRIDHVLLHVVPLRLQLLDRSPLIYACPTALFQINMVIPYTQIENA